MDIDAQRTLWEFLDEERKTIQTPTQLSIKTHEQMPELDPKFSPSRLSTRLSIKTREQTPESDPQFSPPRPSSASSMIQISPPSPESPWTFSPLKSSPTPSLLYHCIASLHRQEGNILSIAVLKGIVFTGSESSRIRVWRQPECTDRGYVKANSGEVRALLAYGNMLFTAHRDYKVRVWSVPDPENFKSKKLTTLPQRSSLRLFPSRNSHQHKDCISCLAYHHAEGLLYTGSWDKTVRVWKVAEKKCVDSFVAHEDKLNAIVVNQEDGCVFTGSSDGSIKIWRRIYGDSSHTLTMTLKFQPSPVNALALSLSSNACFLYSGSSDGFINFWEKEKESGRFNHGGYLQGHRFAVLCLVAIERLVFSGSEDTTIRVWRREEGSSIHACLAVLDGHGGAVRCLAACLEMEKVVMGFLVYSASLDRTFRIWRVKVFPTETKVKLEDTKWTDQKTKNLEYATSPVLSPSWVKRKLQGNHF